MRRDHAGRGTIQKIYSTSPRQLVHAYSVLSAPLCLCSQMQFLPLNASTADLTRSFGWDQYGALMQEDVHEFNKILCDALDEKMKVRGSIPWIPVLYIYVTLLALRYDCTADPEGNV